MVRVVLDTAGHPRAGAGAPGRGAWLCGPACVDPAARRRGFERAFRRPVVPNVGDEVLAVLPESATDHTENENDPVMNDTVMARTNGSARRETLTTRAKG